MDVIIIFNGLGNQMSQYAFLLAKRRNSRAIPLFYMSNSGHNGLELDTLFGVKFPNEITKRILDWLYKSVQMKRRKKVLNKMGIRFYKEPLNYDYVQEYVSESRWGINFYFGGWHSEKYFLDIREEVKRAFTFPEDDDPIFQDLIQKIKATKNSVSLHVRRGDYLNINPDDYYQFGGVATTEYYNQAIAFVKEKFPDSQFFVFSNDVEWCRENLVENNFSYIDCNREKKSWRDLYLMMQCKHHIIANSTFSWWGAWLSENKEGITIHPKWFIRNVETKDFYPERWIEL